MPTSNPVPSQDPSDLLFNAAKLDEVVSGDGQYYTDRRGVNRRTLAGIDAAADVVLSGIGYAPPVAYDSGISLTLQTQTVGYGGEVYAPKVSALPFTTSGTFEAEKFRLIQGVSSVDLSASSGSALVGYDGGTVQDVLDAVTGPTGAALVGYLPAGTGAVATDVQSKLREIVSVKDFGAVGDGVADDTAAWQTAVVYAATNHRALFVPDGVYVVNSKAVLDGINTPFQHVRIYGNARSTGVAAQYQPARAGATILTNNGGALEVWFRAFNNESIDVRGINFVDVATYAGGSLAATPAIKIKKGDPSPAGSGRYITNNNFSDIAAAGYADPIVFQGMFPKATHSWLNNFIGPTHFTRYYPYMCGTALVLANCTMNRFHMSESLLFDLSAGGIVLRADGDLAAGTGTGGLIYGAFDMVHFEGVTGCFRIPAGLDALIGPQAGGAGARCQLTLNDVTREFCGIYGPGVGGFYSGDPYGIESPVELTINGRTDPALAYGDQSLINIPARSVVSSQSKIKMRTSDGAAAPITQILTPETINDIDESFTLAAGSSVIKTIVLAEGAGIDFVAEVDVVVAYGAYGKKHCTTYGRTGGTIYRDLSGTTNITVTIRDGGASSIAEIYINNDSAFALPVRVRMTTVSRIQTYLD